MTDGDLGHINIAFNYCRCKGYEDLANALKCIKEGKPWQVVYVKIRNCKFHFVVDNNSDFGTLQWLLEQKLIGKPEFQGLMDAVKHEYVELYFKKQFKTKIFDTKESVLSNTNPCEILNLVKCTEL